MNQKRLISIVTLISIAFSSWIIGEKLSLGVDLNFCAIYTLSGVIFAYLFKKELIQKRNLFCISIFAIVTLVFSIIPIITKRPLNISYSLFCGLLLGISVFATSTWLQTTQS